MDQIILMGDVVKSRDHDPATLATALGRVTAQANAQQRAHLKSPLTVTLGDEFQGICTDLAAGLAMVLMLNRLLLTSPYPFRLRFVLLQGPVDTPINPDVAYGMLGAGLTHARGLLSFKTAPRKTTQIALRDTRQTDLLNEVFTIFDTIWGTGGARKHPAILEELVFTDATDAQIATRFGKTRSEIWKYSQNWNVEVYRAARRVIEQGLYT